MHTLRIIVPDSPGLLNDAEVYKTAFIKNNFNVIIHKIVCGKAEIIVHKFCDINLILEYLDIDIFAFPSKINMFMPNHELFRYYDKLMNMDYILCKTKIALSMFKCIKKENNYKYICFYTKFTTHISKELRITNDMNIIKDKNLFVHLAGKSGLKNTSILIYCWIKNNGFLDIDPNIKLVITCYRNCFVKTKKELASYFNFVPSFQKENNRDDILVYKNMKLYIYPAPKNEFETLLKFANVSICISGKEGFGHYINEARYYKTYVITVDAPPMNELIKNNKNGIYVTKYDKIKINNHEEHTKFKQYTVYPDVNDLKEKLIYCIKNKNLLSDMGNYSRKLFFKDKKYFNKKISKIINNNLLKKIT